MVRVSGRRSAGILLYRRLAGTAGRTDPGVEVLLAHPGGPYFADRDAGAWGIPKGEFGAGETAIDVARREFAEETGHPAPAGEPIELGEITQKGGKVVAAWALEGDLDPDAATSNTFPMEWPPRSGQFVETPEIDRVAWFSPAEARMRMKDTQIPFVERLLAALGVSPD